MRDISQRKRVEGSETLTILVWGTLQNWLSAVMDGKGHRIFPLARKENGMGFFYPSNVQEALSDFRFTEHCPIACAASATRAEGGRWDSSVQPGKWGCIRGCMKDLECIFEWKLLQIWLKIALKEELCAKGSQYFFPNKKLSNLFYRNWIWFSGFLHL